MALLLAVREVPVTVITTLSLWVVMVRPLEYATAPFELTAPARTLPPLLPWRVSLASTVHRNTSIPDLLQGSGRNGFAFYFIHVYVSESTGYITIKGGCIGGNVITAIVSPVLVMVLLAMLIPAPAV